MVAEGPEVVSYGSDAISPEAAYACLRPVLDDRPTEEFWVLLLDGRHRVLGLAQVTVGTLTASLVHPREVFGPAIRLGAAGLIVAHNHPSGDPEPSTEDLEVTRRLLEVGKLVGIPLLDHLVMGDGSFVSLRRRMGF
ncbi:hypothetical protein Pla86_14010 [Planctomycetes bacterium Pla86]|uniref:MPN domain-containing protein n=1 Tax=Engelhardtia mirabilis TaxID=2528011 RepID=A0A518BH75_9BACT|nr:hypothetical protein Pla133_14020 [Planctomycetes bacterium Pla133]QDV00658.1 hypothetical protein Pla86_14010 [Planctomycetes bacterium Pla86]